jgi:TolA-binding protein
MEGTPVVTAKPWLEPPQTLETGTLVLLRMAAHSRSPNQQEYFAPAVVLAQYEPNGEIDALVWDASAGNAFVHGYAIRDLGTRDTAAGREQYVIQSNIGQVLFSPQQFDRMQQELEILSMELHQKHRAMRDLTARIESLEAAATTPAATSDAAPAASLEAKSDPKGQTKRT